MPRSLLIVNPIAGRGAGQACLERIRRGLRDLGFSTLDAVTAQAGDAREAASAQAGHCDLVAVIGGDGTLNEVVNGLQMDRPLALFPLGTGNVLAKELRLPRRVEAFIEMVARGRLKQLDVPAANGRRFVAMLGAGLDADVTALLAARRRGATRMVRYVRPLLKCLAQRRPPRMEVCVDGAPPAVGEGFALVSNTRSYGGPFRITPQAAADDGLLDVCLLRRGGPVAYSRAILAFTLRCSRLSGAQYLRGRHVRIESPDPVRYQVDGDAVGLLPVTIGIDGRKLRIVVP
ncbi:MAG TPA: diacylglycerol kinase family lipid kinase [Planctomycetota bacterium]|nr:diacylglycerol kinase family lipid kinase [Planctomycetota bacterium]HRR82716.1 diacylglycerol kinase family lipid kinase [Planctomycetota bacterium]HRT95945.1 diacylglycerol kinase family lipid kinase [Planctomycetota bacterium]